MWVFSVLENRNNYVWFSTGPTTTGGVSGLGKPLKVEVNHHSGSSSARPSASSSLEVSPVKNPATASNDKTTTRDYSPPRVTQDVKLG